MTRGDKGADWRGWHKCERGSKREVREEASGEVAMATGNWVDSDETYLLYNFISRNQVNNYLYRLKINK
jgi:hypothetical protein